MRRPAQYDNVQADNRVVFVGGSQGGHAALWVDLLAPYYAPELNLLGGVATVPPADLYGQSARALTSVVDATAGAGTDLAVPVAVPALQEGSWTVVVTNGENQVGTATEVLTVTKPIRVTLVDPEAGFADESTEVRMEGTGFEGVTQVLFGTAPCTDLLVEDDTRISCTVPAGVAEA